MSSATNAMPSPMPRTSAKFLLTEPFHRLIVLGGLEPSCKISFVCAGAAQQQNVLDKNSHQIRSLPPLGLVSLLRTVSRASPLDTMS